MRITNFCGMDFLSTVPVLRFFLQKLELGKSQSYVIFLDADGPLHDAERGEKVGISFDLLFG